VEKTLHQSASRKDLHRQHKLSKRVSDLETKLQEARRELTSAINNTSPLPSFPSRFERFTPTVSKRTNRLVPGKLPSLPSGRLFFTGQRDEELAQTQVDTQHVTGLNYHTAQETFEAEPATAQEGGHTDNHIVAELEATVTAFKEVSSGNQNVMDPTSFMDNHVQATPNEEDKAAFEDRMQVLDEQANHQSKKSSKTKKRKSGDGDGEKLFKPGKVNDDLEDDDEWEEGKVRSKKKQRKTSTFTKTGKTLKTKKSTSKVPVISTTNDMTPIIEAPAMEDEESLPVRTSLDSQLEPIYEEDSNEATPKADRISLAPPAVGGNGRARSRSPSRMGRMNSRSRSPAKIVQGGSQSLADELSQARDDVARGIKSPAGLNAIVEKATEEAAIARDGTVQTEKRTTTSKGTGKENFEWPEDVF